MKIVKLIGLVFLMTLIVLILLIIGVWMLKQITSIMPSHFEEPFSRVGIGIISGMCSIVFILAEPITDRLLSYLFRFPTVRARVLTLPTNKFEGFIGSAIRLTLTGITTNQNRGRISPSVYV